ncbi:hypothetical protein K0M31_019884 [Melipona bicolor]|uniref:Prolyl 4-hydroxylase N-terminal domain-containing protein n=1 Tax=Melipona bicolor TaxID=60889 RepID=A0AA40G1D8_9HYME|nr:hypothetical protein K0M31_019884 [Melipona bicolor]
MTNGRMTRSWIAVFVLISMAGTWLEQHGCLAELYTALADMEELLETEAVLIDTLNGYIKAQEERLATLRNNSAFRVAAANTFRIGNFISGLLIPFCPSITDEPLKHLEIRGNSWFSVDLEL